MSRRYGRNQKRQHRQQIAQLEQQVQRGQKQVKELEMLGAKNSRIVEDTANVLGRHFITLPPSNHHVLSLQDIGDHFRIPMMTKAPTTYCDAVPQFANFLDVALPVVSASSHIDELHMQQHVRLRYNGETVAYAISLKSLNMLGAEMAARRIAEEMGPYLVKMLGVRP